jgi:hypothetical protein
MSAPEKTGQKHYVYPTAQFCITWTPRILVASFAGYYSLGIAYEAGIMRAIDKLAIAIMKNSMGYAGIGAAMPTFQWYSAWAVRTVSAAGAGLIYDLLERQTVSTYRRLRGSTPPPKPPFESVPV